MADSMKVYSHWLSLNHGYLVIMYSFFLLQLIGRTRMLIPYSNAHHTSIVITPSYIINFLFAYTAPLIDQHLNRAQYGRG